jgi:peptidyl-prolyl cis-trans isomerase C
MRRSALALVCLATLATCKRQAGDGSSSRVVAVKDVIARVGDHVITVADLERELARLPPFSRARYASPQGKKELLENLVQVQVMADEARRRGYDHDPDVVRLFNQQLVNHLVHRDLDETFQMSDVPEPQAEAYYREHRSEFVQPEEVRVGEIIVRDRSKAARVAKVVAAVRPEDDQGFRELVTSSSEDESSKQRGGDLGFFSRATGSEPNAVIDAAFMLKAVGSVSPPIESPKGFHILRLTGRRPSFVRPFSEVRQQIQARLYHELRNQKMREWIADLRRKSAVETFDGKLADVKVDTATPTPVRRTRSTAVLPTN